MSTSFHRTKIQIRTTSVARNMHELKLDIQDALIDLWHHPQVAKSCICQQHHESKVHIQVLVNLLTLSRTTSIQAQTDIQSICEWLQTNKITYEVGYSPLILASRFNHEHRLVLNASVHSELAI